MKLCLWQSVHNSTTSTIEGSNENPKRAGRTTKFLWSCLTNIVKRKGMDTVSNGYL